MATSHKRVTKLTAAQRELLPVWRDRWIEIGLSCEPIDLERAKMAVAAAYRAANLPPPTRYITADSPVSAAIVAATLRSSVWGTVRATVRGTVRASVRDSVRDSVGATVGASVGDSVVATVRATVLATVRASVRDSVGASVGASVLATARDSVLATVLDSVLASVGASVLATVGDSVLATVRATVLATVRASVRATVLASVGDSVGDSVRQMVWGAHDAPWLSFYDYFRTVLGLRCCDPLAGLIELAQCCGWWAPYRDCAILQHRHCELHRDSAGRLHRDGGMAVRYRDGWGLWALNGVRVPRWLSETPAEKIDPTKLASESNAEVRREILRKVGAERCWHKLLRKTLDSSGGYELGVVAIGNGRTATVLKMANPSVPEVWHVEFVPQECRTVQQALNFRNGLTPETIDDENGADWYQQGDVILRPRGAAKFKSRPIILT